MTGSLVHRGPDAEGAFVDARVALGHRRLAIIDLADGQQPMAAADGLVQIVFNGEIYNFLEVRSQLELYGHHFRTRSDTEVILHAYLQWGQECLQRLNGMFAFAIWDARIQQLLLGRDRVGKKPLYYWHHSNLIAFASELKALRAGSVCPSAVDSEALDCYLSLGYIPAPRTIYRGVRKLRAAHCLTVTAARLSEHRYWTLSFSQPEVMKCDEITEQSGALLDEAVRSRLMSDVPLGAFLSGGIDSSLVVSSMASLMNRPVITNSIGFDDREHSELPMARLVAEHLGTEHHELVVTPRAADVLERIAWHFDEPMADSSAVPTWYLCQMARRTVTVALSGDGGDEAFGGYTFRYLPHVLESRIRGALPPLLRAPLFGMIGAAWPGSAKMPKPLRLKTILENLAVGDAEAFYRDLSELRPEARDSLYAPEFLAGLRGFTPLEVVAPYYLHSDASDALGRSQCADIQCYLTDDVLVKVDRMSMAHSLEVRAPLLDYRILEFAARIPSRIKMNSRGGKLPLRELAARRLPSRVSVMKKHGFSIPAAKWLRGELRPLAEDLLFGTKGAFEGVIHRPTLSQMWQEHLSAKRDHHTVLWALMMFELWQQNSRPLRQAEDDMGLAVCLT
jgi:asparagine synthase (glutamine-hydrolysing)